MQYQSVLKKAGVAVAIVIVMLIAWRFFFGSSVSTYPRQERSGGMNAPMGIADYGVTNKNAYPAQTEPVMEETISADSELIDDLPAEKKIIKEGDLQVRVDDALWYRGRLEEVARKKGGSIFSSNIQNSATDVKSGTIVVQVPSPRFEETFFAIKEIGGLIIREYTTSQDVTEQYVDLQSRLKNKQSEEEAFARLLERVQDMDDITKVTSQLFRVRGEIESLQGRIRVLESVTDMSKITVQISEDPRITVLDTWRPWQEIKDTVNLLIKDLQRFVDLIIHLIIRVIPVLILYLTILGGIFWVGREVYRKYLSK